MSSAGTTSIAFLLAEIGADYGFCEWEAAPPTLFVQMNLAFTAPADIGGVSVVGIHELVPPTTKDAAYFKAVDWLERCAKSVGHDGRTLQSLHWKGAQDFSLWWSLDLLLHDTAWLWIRAIDAARHVLERFVPQAVYIVGVDPSFAWMQTCLLQAAREYAAQCAHSCSVHLVGLPLRLEAMEERWRQSRNELHGCWTAAGDVMHGFKPSVGPGASARRGPLSLNVCTRDDTYVCSTVARFYSSCVEFGVRLCRGNGGGVGIELDTGGRRQTLTLRPTEVVLGSGEQVAVDTAYMNSYALELRGRHFILYVNNQLALVGRSMPGKRPGLTWGHLSPEGESESEWFFLAWGSRPAVRAVKPATSLRGRLGAMLGLRLRPQHKFHGDTEEEDRTPMLRLPQGARNNAGASASVPVEPATDAWLLLSFGDEQRWFERGGNALLYDQFTDGLKVAIESQGLRAVQVCLKDIHPSIPGALRDREGLLELSRWKDTRFDVDAAQSSLAALWKSWRGPSAAFPPYGACEMADYLAGRVEEYLPHLMPKLTHAEALDEYCRRYRPAVVIFTHFVSSMRNLIDVVHKHGALAVAPIIGCDSQDHMLYGLRNGRQGCPGADLYSVWGEHQVEALLRSGPLLRPLVASGRSRHDVFVGGTLRASKAGWLQAVGLPEEIERVVVFGDVMRSTNFAQILTRASCVRLLRGILQALDGHPELAVIYKPWRGDDLRAVRAVVAEIGDSRLHVLDPDFTPYHNLDLLQHAVTVVSSPTSLLAEFACLGGRPIVLTLPETRYYHGQIIEDLFRPFCRSVETCDDIVAAVREALTRPPGLSEEARTALVRAFGEIDGRNGQRLVGAISAHLAAARQPV